MSTNAEARKKVEDYGRGKITLHRVWAAIERNRNAITYAAQYEDLRNAVVDEIVDHFKKQDKKAGKFSLRS